VFLSVLSQFDLAATQSSRSLPPSVTNGRPHPRPDLNLTRRCQPLQSHPSGPADHTQWPFQTPRRM